MYHRRLFEWHQETFGRYDLAPEEREYLETCFALAEGYEQRADSGYSQYSYYSYSHRVEGSRVNSSRLAYGLLSHASETLAAAVPVLEFRGARVDPFFTRSRHSTFYGLGWDLEEGHFKVYFLVDAAEHLPMASLVRLARIGGEHRPEVLVSLTFLEGNLFEEKVYRYPVESPGTLTSLPAGSSGRALMSTSRRGVVPQYDVGDPLHWLERLNEQGRAIVTAYASIGETLDTVAWSDPHHFTLYFP